MLIAYQNPTKEATLPCQMELTINAQDKKIRDLMKERDELYDQIDILIDQHRDGKCGVRV